MRHYRAFLVRDSVILILTLALWATALPTQAGQIVTGVLTGICALLLPEYGHLIGAIRSGATITPAPIWSPFIFNLDPGENQREQLLATSYSGFAATALFLIVFAILLPKATLAGQLAWYIALLLATLTVVIEFPIAWRIATHRSVPDLSIIRRSE